MQELANPGFSEKLDVHLQNIKMIYQDSIWLTKKSLVPTLAYT